MLEISSSFPSNRESLAQCSWMTAGSSRLLCSVASPGPPPDAIPEDPVSTSAPQTPFHRAPASENNTLNGLVVLKLLQPESKAH